MKKAIHIWDKILEEARNLYGDQTISTDYPFSDYLARVFKERLTSELNTSEDIINAFVDYFDKNELIENGCLALSNLSLAGWIHLTFYLDVIFSLFFLLYLEYGSFVYLDGLYEYELKNGGYRPFISYLKSFIPNDNRVRLNSEVIKVKYLPDQHQLLVTIRTTDEQKISTILCEHIIWTSSLGYLKENFSSIFSDENELIQQKQNAINNLGFDTVNKVTNKTNYFE